MIFTVLRSLFFFFVPCGVLFFTALTVAHHEGLQHWLPALARIFPPVVLALGVLLGWRFNRSRLVFALLVLAVADLAVRHFAPPADMARLVFDAVSLLAPVNLTLLFFARERGILTARGIVRIAFILLQPALLIVAWYHDGPALAGVLAHRLLDWPLLAGLPLAQPGLFAFSLAFLVMGVAMVRAPGPVENGFFWAMLAVLAGLVAVTPGIRSTLYFSTAGLILVVAVIEAAYGMAFRDELTGLPGRRALNEALLKVGGRYAVAMLDIDFFKKFNDRHGHDVGDQVLRMVAGKMARVAGGGKAYRYGGEEFTIVFPGKAVDEALPHLEQVRKEVEEAAFVLRGGNRPKKKPKKKPARGKAGKKVSVTISIGVAGPEGRQCKPAAVVKEADKALYRAKKQGRNQVAV